MYARHTASSWDGVQKLWLDVSGNGRHAYATKGEVTTIVQGEAPNTWNALVGSTTTAVRFPGSIPADFTICSVTKYNGNARGRIIQASGDNLVHGHYRGNAGVVHHRREWPLYIGWRTPESGVITNRDDWLIMCGTTDGCDMWANGINVCNKAVKGAGAWRTGTDLRINDGAWSGEVSDWAAAEIIVWDVPLNSTELDVVFRYLRNHYALPLALPALPPPSPPVESSMGYLAAHFSLTGKPLEMYPESVSTPVGAHEVTSHGKPSIDTAGYLAFDGVDDYLSLGPKRLGGAMSIGAWIKPANDARSWERMFDAWTTTGGANIAVARYGTSTQCRFHVVVPTFYAGTTTTYRSTYTATSGSGCWEAQSWFHLSASIGDNTMRLFKNGETIATASKVREPQLTTYDNVYVGKSKSSRDANFKGSMFDFYIFGASMMEPGEIFAYAANLEGFSAAPPPYFPAAFTCPFGQSCTAQSFPRCPCHAAECAVSNGNPTTFAFEALQPGCMRITLRYCRSSSSESASALCAKFKTRKQVVKTIGTSGGVIEGDDMPSYGGFGTRVNVPAGALTNDVEIGVGQLDVSEISARLPLNVSLKSSLISLTPYRQSLLEDFVIEIPISHSARSSGTLSVLQVLNTSDTTWAVLPFSRLTYHDSSILMVGVLVSSACVLAVVESEKTPAFRSWMMSGGGPSIDRLYSVALSTTDGAVVAAGAQTNTATFGSEVVTSSGSEDTVLWKINSQGTTLWAVFAGGGGSDSLRGVDVDEFGDIVTAGHFSSTLSSFGFSVLANHGGHDAVIWKLSGQGTPVWAISSAGPGSEYLYSVVVASDLTSASAGYFSSASSCTFGATVFLSPQGNDAVIWRVNHLGGDAAGGFGGGGGINVCRVA